MARKHLRLVPGVAVPGVRVLVWAGPAELLERKLIEEDKIDPEDLARAIDNSIHTRMADLNTIAYRRGRDGQLHLLPGISVEMHAEDMVPVFESYYLPIDFSFKDLRTRTRFIHDLLRIITRTRKEIPSIDPLLAWKSI
jgi:DUF438 domain-containing protein